MENRQIIAVAGAILVGLIALAIAVTMTGDEEPPTSTSTTTTSSTTVPTTTDTAPPTSVPGEVGDRLFAQLAARTVDSATRARALTANGSPAAAYFDHQIAALGVVGPQPVSRLEGEDPWAICDDSGTGIVCRSFGSLTTDESGLVTDFEIDRTSVAGRVVIDGNTMTDEGVSLSLVSAFRTIPDDSMVVIVEITNDRAERIIVNGFAAVYSDPTLGDFEITSSVGIDEIAAGGSARMLFVFDGGDIGADLVLPMTNEDFTESFELTLTVAAP